MQQSTVQCSKVKMHCAMHSRNSRHSQSGGGQWTDLHLQGLVGIILANDALVNLKSAKHI